MGYSRWGYSRLGEVAPPFAVGSGQIHNDGPLPGGDRDIWMRKGKSCWLGTLSRALNSKTGQKMVAKLTPRAVPIPSPALAFASKTPRRAFPFHRRRILLSWFSQCQPGTAGFLPKDPLRHPRLETELRPSQHHREIQRHAQRQRRIERGVVPGFRPCRSNHRSVGPGNSPQPKGTQKGSQKGTQTPPQPPKTQRCHPRS